MDEDRPKGNPEELKKENRSEEDKMMDPRDVAESKRDRWEEWRVTHGHDHETRD